MINVKVKQVRFDIIKIVYKLCTCIMFQNNSQIGYILHVFIQLQNRRSIPFCTNLKIILKVLEF